MLIGNTWVKGARLRILNCALLPAPAAGAWGVAPQTLILNNEEHAFIVGLQMIFTACAGGMLEAQVLYDGTAAHEGFFRSVTDAGANAITLRGNQQPTTMAMPFLDVPRDTEIGLRARWGIGCAGGANVYYDLYIVSYYMRDQDQAAPVCFPPSAWPLPCP